MVRQRDQELFENLDAGLRNFETSRPLPGLQSHARRNAFLEQPIESVRRTNLPAQFAKRNISPQCADPGSDLFHPLKAAAYLKSVGKADDSFWMVFLFVHFGKHPRAGWRYARAILSGLSSGPCWDWATISADPLEFRHWLHKHQHEIRSSSPSGGFGNHRKYESLHAYSTNGTGSVVATYVDWISPPRSHEEMVAEVMQSSNGDSRLAFRALYGSMKFNVARFGRLASIDYLATVGKLGLAPIVPDSAYLSHAATGPLVGAQLLFGQGATARDLDKLVLELDSDVRVGLHALEDALCNWQKSPDEFRKFSG